MTPTTPTDEQLRDFLAWWMSNEVPPDAKYRDEPGGKEDQCRAAFLEGWECGEGNAIVKTTDPLVGTLKAVEILGPDKEGRLWLHVIGDNGRDAMFALQGRGGPIARSALDAWRKRRDNALLAAQRGVGA